MTRQLATEFAVGSNLPLTWGACHCISSRVCGPLGARRLGHLAVLRARARPDGAPELGCVVGPYWPFTALVTPFELGFLEGPKTWGEVDALFFVNRFIDLIFFKDMVMNFFLAFRDTSQDTRGRLVKDLPSIRRRYLRSWFTLDLVSILPFDILGMSFDSDVVSSLKIIRVIRLLRLLKLVRVFRASRIFARWETQIEVSYSTLA